jgi:hypothetical protein
MRERANASITARPTVNTVALPTHITLEKMVFIDLLLPVVLSTGS